MTDAFEPNPALHGTSHDPSCCAPAPVVEEPLDPANQSLADALRASFRVLKIIMLLVVICYVLSGFFIVDQNEVVILSRFGKRLGEPAGPGLKWAFPYPIDSRLRIRTDTRAIEVRSFWLNLTKAEEQRPLSQIYAPTNSLDPKSGGALLTAAERHGEAFGETSSEGAELVHVKWPLTYRITDPLGYAENIVDETLTVQSVFEASAVAMAARFTVDEIAFVNQNQFRIAVQEEAQRRLDAVRSGIVLDQVNSVPYQPLQVRDEFDAVIRAENTKRSAIQAANQESRRILNEAAGEAHPTIIQAIRDYETARLGDAPSAERKALENRIDQLLLTVARGKASQAVKQGRAEGDQIVQALRADAKTLEELKPKYAESPVLLPVRMWEDAKRDVFAQEGVTRFFLPPGADRLVIWLNPDPEHKREEIRKRLLSVQ
ncbi:MAG: hypothetical protein JXA69_10455 [Phycisphaerae bacterium]|nr:hypothetical protein [Phycisphaerae bacterium]